MIHRIRRALVAGAFFLLGTAGCVADAAAQAPSRPPVVGTALGSILVSQGASWTDIARADWASTSPYSIPSTAKMVELVVKNTHASQALFVLLRANAGEATPNAIYIGPGAAQTLPVWGMNVSTISVQGAGAATTARLDSSWATP